MLAELLSSELATDDDITLAEGVLRDEALGGGIAGSAAYLDSGSRPTESELDDTEFIEDDEVLPPDAGPQAMGPRRDDEEGYR